MNKQQVVLAAAAVMLLGSTQVSAAQPTMLPGAFQATNCPDYRSILKLTAAAMNQLAPSLGQAISPGGPVVKRIGTLYYGYSGTLIPGLTCQFDPSYRSQGRFKTECTAPVKDVADSQVLERTHWLCLRQAGSSMKQGEFSFPEGSVGTHAFKSQFVLFFAVSGRDWPRPGSH